MRPRHEIEAEAEELTGEGFDVESDFAKLQLEVLLDIRDFQAAALALLDTRPSVAYPESPPAPEVGG